jgi:hypothetical protein
MYSLLMTAESDAWSKPTFVISAHRYLEHTNEVLRAKFSPMSDEVIYGLKTMPALFTYEKFVKESARVGRITEIQCLTQEFRLTLALDASVPPIAPEQLEQLYSELDIGKKYEVHRTHWAIKDVDLGEVLKNAGLITRANLAPQARPPKVFISYSWDSPEHRQWVAQLGQYLRHQGIDIVLDQWHLWGGADVAAFMQRSLREADRVLVICTQNYADKAARNAGGVGFEHMIVTGQLMQNLGTDKFIPIVLQGKDPPLPSVLATRYFYNLGAAPGYALQLDALVKELHGIRPPLPPLGPNPYA